MTNFWKDLTKSEIDGLIKMHKDVATMNEQLQEKRKQEAVDALRTYLLEKEAEWWDRPGHIELFNDLHSRSVMILTDGDIEEITEEISKMAWQDPNMQARLTLAKSQAADGYNQAQTAFKLLAQVYEFLVRLSKPSYHNMVVALMASIEEFLPGLKEKYS